MLRKLVLLGLAAAAVVALTRWPWVNDVETGASGAYPDLRVREYRQSEAAVARAAEEAVGELDRFTLVGSGSGPKGHALAAVARTRILGFQDDVTVRVWREGGKTRLSVRSRSRMGKIDFGQNARNIRELVTAIDGRLGAGG